MDGQQDLQQRLTIGISSFERPEALFRLVRSIRQYYPNVIIAIADDSSEAVFLEVQRIYTVTDGILLLRCDYDSGLSVKRNALVAACQTELFCLCDDDFVFTATTDLSLLVAAIDAGCDLAAGSVGATVPYCHKFVRRGSVLFEEPIRLDDNDLTTFAGYPLYDLLLNFFVARRSAIAAVPWDPPLKMHEHGDWFLRLPHLKKTLVPECLVDHVREAPGEYAEHRAFKVVSCLGTRMERLIARGLTHYVSDDGRIMVVERERAQVAQKVEKAIAQRDHGPFTARAAAANWVGPSIGKHGEDLRPPKVAEIVEAPPKPKPVVGAHKLTVADLPTKEMFYGLPITSTRVSPWVMDDGPLAIGGTRVLVIGSAPAALLPPLDNYDVIFVANGGIAHVPTTYRGPLIAVVVDAILGLVSDQHGTHRAAVEGYAGRNLSAVVVHSGAWSDYHDPLSATWYERHEDDLAALWLAANDQCRPWGLTPAGRDRILAIDGKLIHGAVADKPATWGWHAGGWSTGIVAVALARAYGAAAITLAGISLNQTGHVHAEFDSDGRRAHLLGDLAWLTAAAQANPGLLSTTDAQLGAAVAIPVILPADAPR